MSYHYDESAAGRPNFFRRALAETYPFAELSILTSNFDHIRKRVVPSERPEVERLPVRSYSKNMSLARILSYLDFARSVRKSLAVARAGLVIVCVPDYLSAFVLLRAKSRRDYRIVVDVVDLWPEAFPVSGMFLRFAKIALVPIFRRARSYFFRHAELITFQSEYFQRLFGGGSGRRFFLPMCTDRSCGTDSPIARCPIVMGIKIVFLGSMNNICDVDSLVEILNMLAVHRPVHLDVVGGGEALEELKRRLWRSSVDANYHGITFDPKIVETALKHAHFGYNGYKKTTEVAVSYKSLEYLKCGLPLLNSAKGDTWNLVERERIGLNFRRGGIGVLTDEIMRMSEEEHKRMAQNALIVFEANYSYGRFREALRGYLSAVVDWHK